MAAPCNLELAKEFVTACTWVDNDVGGTVFNILLHIAGAMLNGSWTDLAEDFDEDGNPETNYYVGAIEHLKDMGWWEKVQPWLDPEPWDEARLTAHFVSIALSPEPK